VELVAAISNDKPIVFRCAAFANVGEDAVEVVASGGHHMLANFSFLVDVLQAEAAVPADVVRELAAIRESPGGAKGVNKAVRQALLAGMVAVREGESAVDAYRCGEPEALSAMPGEKVLGAVKAACAAGEAGAVAALLGRAGVAARVAGDPHALFSASGNGHVEVVRLLLGVADMDVNRAKADDGATALFVAAQNGEAAVVQLLLGVEGIEVNKANEDGVTPLCNAAWNGQVKVARALLGVEGIEVNKASKDGITPLFVAAREGYAAVVELLLAAGADRSTKDNQGSTALDVATRHGLAPIAALATTA
jgi:hypothetical protein